MFSCLVFSRFPGILSILDTSMEGFFFFSQFDDKFRISVEDDHICLNTEIIGEVSDVIVELLNKSHFF